MLEPRDGDKRCGMLMGGAEDWPWRGGLKRQLDENFDVFVMSKHRSKPYFIIHVKSPFVWTCGLLGTQRTQGCTKRGKRVAEKRSQLMPEMKGMLGSHAEGLRAVTPVDFAGQALYGFHFLSALE